MGSSKFCRESENSIKAHQRQFINVPKTTLKDHKESTIVFKESEAKGLVTPHDDALVIELDVSNCVVARILVDNMSSVDVIFRSTLKKMNIDDSWILEPRWFVGKSLISQIEHIRILKEPK